MRLSIYLAVAIGISVAERVITGVGVLIQTLRVLKISVRNRLWLRTPVGRHEATDRRFIVPRPEVIQPSLCIVFLSGKLLVHTISGGAPLVAAPEHAGVDLLAEKQKVMARSNCSRLAGD